jgi:hypothetical protein
MSINKSIKSASKSEYPSQLCVEHLEPRMMLSSVSIEAAGETGEENIRITVDEEVVVDQVVSQTGSTFNFDVADSISVSDIRIEFTNDLYQPDQGIDRNLIINSYSFDGVENDLFGSNAFSTGTWRPEDGINDGFGRGNILHSFGYIQVDESNPESQFVEFNGNTWNVSRDFSSDQISLDTQYNELVISGADREIAISRQIDFDPGVLSELTVDAWRNVVAGGFANNGASNAGAGVDFFNESGDLIRQVSFQLNNNATDPSNRVQARRFFSPDNATSAYLWVWAGNEEAPNDIPIRLTDLRLETVDTSVDNEAPTATLESGVIGEFRGEAFIPVTIADNLQFSSFGDLSNNIELRVVGPDGVEQISRTASFSAIAPAELFFSFRIRRPGGGDFTSADNGIYEVFLVEGTLFDAAGNVAPGGSLGTVELIV